MRLYKELLEDCEIPETRSEPLAEALKNLHSAICCLDQVNRARFSFINPDAVQAVIEYARIEELNTELWGLDGNVTMSQSLSEPFIIEFIPDQPAPKPKSDGNVHNMEDYRKNDD